MPEPGGQVDAITGETELRLSQQILIAPAAEDEHGLEGSPNAGVRRWDGGLQPGHEPGPQVDVPRTGVEQGQRKEEGGEGLVPSAVADQARRQQEQPEQTGGHHQQGKGFCIENSVMRTGSRIQPSGCVLALGDALPISRSAGT
jgi:hypothetical protein